MPGEQVSALLGEREHLGEDERHVARLVDEVLGRSRREQPGSTAGRRGYDDETPFDPLLKQGVVDETLGVEPVGEHDQREMVCRCLPAGASASGCDPGVPTAGYRTQVDRFRYGSAGALPLAGVPRLWSTKLRISRPTP